MLATLTRSPLIAEPPPPPPPPRSAMHGVATGDKMVPPVSHLVHRSAGFSLRPTRMLDGFHD